MRKKVLYYLLLIESDVVFALDYLQLFSFPRPGQRGSIILKEFQSVLDVYTVREVGLFNIVQSNVILDSVCMYLLKWRISMVSLIY